MHRNTRLRLLKASWMSGHLCVFNLIFFRLLLLCSPFYLFIGYWLEYFPCKASHAFVFRTNQRRFNHSVFDWQYHFLFLSFRFFFNLLIWIAIFHAVRSRFHAIPLECVCVCAVSSFKISHLFLRISSIGCFYSSNKRDAELLSNRLTI